MSGITKKPEGMSEDFYRTEVIEAFNVAISALETHEPADGDPSGIAFKLRADVSKKLDRSIRKWLDHRMKHFSRRP